MLQVQFRNVKANDRCSSRTRRPRWWSRPRRYQSGTIIYRYEKAKSPVFAGAYGRLPSGREAPRARAQRGTTVAGGAAASPFRRASASRYTLVVRQQQTATTGQPIPHMRPSASAGFGRIKANPPHAAPGQAIGLLGGSFNPPHAAHRMISEVALKRLGLDKVWWIVSPGNPLKKRSEAAPLAERMVLCRECCEESPHRRYRFRSRLADAVHRLDAGVPENSQSACALRLDHGGGQPCHLRSMAALAGDLHHGPRGRRRPAGMAPEGVGLQSCPCVCRIPRAGDGGSWPGAHAGARLDVPHRPALARFLDGAAQQGASPRRKRC